LDWRFDGLTALVSIAAGKAADLVVLAGNRAKNIDDDARVETVFKDGVGYDPAKVFSRYFLHENVYGSKVSFMDRNRYVDQSR
jgi:hypothetical protein